MTIKVPNGVQLLVEPAQLAKLLGVGPVRVAQLINAGTIPPPKQQNGPRRAYSLREALAIANERGIGGRPNVKFVIQK